MLPKVFTSAFKQSIDSLLEMFPPQSRAWTRSESICSTEAIWTWRWCLELVNQDNSELSKSKQIHPKPNTFSRRMESSSWRWTISQDNHWIRPKLTSNKVSQQCLVALIADGTSPTVFFRKNVIVQRTKYCIGFTSLETSSLNSIGEIVWLLVREN